MKAAAVDLEKEGSFQSFARPIKEEVLEGSTSLSRPTVKVEVDRSPERSISSHRFGGRDVLRQVKQLRRAGGEAPSGG